MKCPNCKNELTQVEIDGINVDHCPACGGTFFDQNEINLISTKYARYLKRMKRSDIISSEEKLCPRDHTPLENLVSEAKPQHITLLQCPQCHGIFAYADDLLEFEKAREAKLNYIKAWKIPMPHLNTVLVYSLALVVGLSMYWGTTITNQNQHTSIKAMDVAKNIEVIKGDQDTIICFTTDKEMSSKITFRNIRSNETVVRSMSTVPSRLHCKTFPASDIPTKETLYKITLSSTDGVTIEGDFMRL